MQIQMQIVILRIHMEERTIKDLEELETLQREGPRGS